MLVGLRARNGLKRGHVSIDNMKRLLLLLTLCFPSIAHAQLLPYVQGGFFDNAGHMLSGGKICTAASGTSTNKATYPTAADAAAHTNANANPVTLDAYGRANIWLDGTYRIIVYASGTGNTCNGSSVGTALKTIDGVSSTSSGPSTLWTATGAATGVYPTTTTNDVIAGASSLPSSFGSGGGVLGTTVGLHVFSGSTANENDMNIRSTGGAITFDERAFGSASHVPVIFRVNGGSKFGINTDGGVQYYGTTAVSGVSGAGVLYYDSALNKFRCSQNGAAMSDCLAGGSASVGGWTATGSTVYVTNTTAQMIAGMTTTDSTSKIVGMTNITVATTSANGATLNVNASSGATTVSIDTGKTGTGTTRPLLFTVDGTEAARIFTNRRVGINQTTDNGYAMQVGGTMAATNLSINSGGTSYGTIAGNGTEIDLCSATGPCASGFGAFATYGTAFGTDVTPLRVISGAGTSGMAIYTGTSVFSGSLVAAVGEIDLCSAAGPCNSGYGVFPTYTTQFGSDALGYRIVSTGTTAGLGMYTSSIYRGGLTANSTAISFCSAGSCATGLSLTSSAATLLGTSTNILDIKTSNATNIVRFYAGTSTLTATMPSNATEFDICSPTGPCNGGIGIYTNGNFVSIFGGGQPGVKVGNNSTDNVCILVGGSVRLLALGGGGAIVDGGACPF